jgi:predicted  nucleic acid-binding Zn-ribbon protein
MKKGVMMVDLSQKAQEYKSRVEQLQSQKQDLEKQLIILEEQYKQYQETIEKAFQTTDPEKLREIASSYLKDIEVLESQLDES